jgi:hypothetical protein
MPSQVENIADFNRFNFFPDLREPKAPSPVDITYIIRGQEDSRSQGIRIQGETQ